MPTPPVLDFDALLAPISDDQPTGVNLKTDPKSGELYHKIKREADLSRTSERLLRVAERNEDGSVKDKIDPPVWPSVVEQSIRVLTETSKDLWITAWLIEGLARQDGFAGLRDGFRLVRELSERYWEGLHPPLDEDDVAEGEYTATIQLSRLVGGETEGTLVGPILQIPIVSSSKHGEYSSADYLLAEDLEQMTDPVARQNRIDAGAVTLAQFEPAADETPAEFYQNLLEDVSECIDEYRKMGDLLVEKCVDADGNQLAPTVSQTERLLDECRERIKYVSRNVLATDEEGAGEDAAACGAGAASGTVGNREAAFRELLKIADFFSRTEPHSPVSYALRQVVSWGRMSLPELLAELIEEPGVRDTLFKRTGIPRPESNEPASS
ncbi:MAG: type VI secretion system protein TssA [Planctomycetia bacterium]|nr:type VI secretion system protein TssA [Planctomycetia bacterium]